MASIVVIGSINMDLVCRTRRIPQPGETILGEEFVTIPGGKGANQAVAAAKLARSDTRVHLVGRVGDDDFGRRLLQGLRDHRVATDHVTVTPRVASGCAMILVDRKGENSIVVAPGANAQLTPDDVDRAADIIHQASAVVLQLEIPQETVRHTIRMCRSLGVFTILDPAPAPPRPLERAMLDVDILTPNQSEAGMLLGLDPSPRVRRKRPEDAKQIGGDLLERSGARVVVLKLGARGAMILGPADRLERVRPFKVKVVDTTAAGDTFTAALAIGRAEGMSLKDSVRLGNAAGAICCQTFGAQPALPTRESVDRLLAASQP